MALELPFVVGRSEIVLLWAGSEAELVAIKEFVDSTVNFSGHKHQL